MLACIVHAFSIITIKMMLLSPYIQLARLERPIGSWLLLLPCWWGLAAQGGPISIHEALWFGFLFALGAVLMRGAGCTYNDLVDHPFDGKVERTKTRPLPAGAVSRTGAVGFLLLQLFGGAVVLLQFNQQTIVLGLLSLVLIAIYPFMKRVTYMPQFFLGLAFSWGVLMGVSALTESVPLSTFILYAASVFWVIGYDTIYALQDREDDLLLGLKSSAILFGGRVKLALALLYSLAWICFALFGFSTAAHSAFYIGLLFVGAHFAWQIMTLDITSSTSALKIFKSNRDGGLIVLASLILSSL
jgi:4-hydroxybenzoate polyprenyltransferase